MSETFEESMERMVTEAYKDAPRADLIREIARLRSENSRLKLRTVDDLIRQMIDDAVENAREPLRY